MDPTGSRATSKSNRTNDYRCKTKHSFQQANTIISLYLQSQFDLTVPCLIYRLIRLIFFFCLLGWFFCNYYRSVPIIDLFPLFLKLSLLSLLLILSFFFALLYLKICLYSMGLPSLFSYLFSIFFGLLFLYCLFFSPLFPDFSICSQHFTTVFLSHIFLLYSTVQYSTYCIISLYSTFLYMSVVITET